jgi:hypothetical protein
MIMDRDSSVRLVIMDRDSSVSLVIKVRAKRPLFGYLQRQKLISPKRPVRSWGSHSHLSCGYLENVFLRLELQDSAMCSRS